MICFRIIYFIVGSDSDSEDKVPTSPVIAGPPPPPLRGIPHLNPDAVDISDEPPRPQPDVPPMITTILPSPTQPPVRRHSTALDGFGVGDLHQPKLHPGPLLSSPQSNFQRVLGPQSSPIRHGEASAHTAPLSPVAPSPIHRKTSLTLQLDAKSATERGVVSPSLRPAVEQPTHLFREPLLVSPLGPGHTSKPLSLSPIASPVGTSPVASMSTPTSAPSAPAETDRQSLIAPVKPEVVQEGSSDQRLINKAERESKEDLSSESSEESQTSDAESTDLQDEARDTFDTSKHIIVLVKFLSLSTLICTYRNAANTTTTIAAHAT